MKQFKITKLSEIRWFDRKIKNFKIVKNNNKKIANGTKQTKKLKNTKHI